MVDLYKKCLEVIFNHVFELLVVEMWIKMLFIFTFAQKKKKQHFNSHFNYQEFKKHFKLLEDIFCTNQPYGVK